MIRAIVALYLTSLLPFLFTTSSPAAFGQTVPPACPAPPSVLKSTQPNIFSEQQEQWLGDAMAERLAGMYTPVKDAAQNAYLDKIGSRLLAVLPPTQIKFRFELVESSEINGFSLAGGHVYLTRKLVANARSEDEVAGVIAHEMGHILTHQFAIETTADLKKLLGVTSVGDRADIYTKFQQLLDAQMKAKHSSGGDTDEKQDEADRVSVYATAAAGYRPQAYSEFWDRSFYVDGKVGGRLSDFFGTTKPNEKRLRAILKLIAAIPPGCGGATAVASAEFKEWQRRVVANQAVVKALETKPLAEVALTPPLRMELERLRFSRDGKSILAQDESSIFVLSREPYKTLFRFDAEDSMAAEFSPDSQHIVFHTPRLHTEEWSVPEQKLIAAHEPTTRHDCVQTTLSPDGRTLVCLSWGDMLELNLELLDVATGTVLFEKKPFFQPTYYFYLRVALNRFEGAGHGVVPTSFSADGNTLLIGPGDAKLAFDLRTRTQIKTGGDLRGGITGTFAFEGNGKVVGINNVDPGASGVFSFPDGKRLQKFKMNVGRLESVSDGDYVLEPELKDFAVGLADLSGGKFLLLSKSPALDYWDGFVASENKDGAVMLAKLTEPDTSKYQRIMLPQSPLGRPRTLSLSPDGRYLVLSTRARGGVWDLTTGKQLYLMRGFTSSGFDKNGTLYVEFPKAEGQDRIAAQVSLLTHSVTKQNYELAEGMHMWGSIILEWKNQGKNWWELVAHDVQTNAVLWNRTFEREQPGYTENDGGTEMIFSSMLKSTVGKAELKAQPALAAEAAAVTDKDAGRVIEVVDEATGKQLGAVVIEVPTRYEGVNGINRVGDLLYVSSGDNRTVVYSMETGKQMRQIFGYVMAVDPDTKRICTVNRRDEAVVYEQGGGEIAHFHLGSPLRFADFRQKGTRLIVLTADQKVRTMAVDSEVASASKQ